MFGNGKTHILMISVLTRLIYRFNTIPVKILPRFMGLWKLNSGSSDSMAHGPGHYEKNPRVTVSPIHR